GVLSARRRRVEPAAAVRPVCGGASAGAPPGAPTHDLERGLRLLRPHDGQHPSATGLHGDRLRGGAFGGTRPSLGRLPAARLWPEPLENRAGLAGTLRPVDHPWRVGASLPTPESETYPGRRGIAPPTAGVQGRAY